MRIETNTSTSSAFEVSSKASERLSLGIPGKTR